MNAAPARPAPAGHERSRRILFVCDRKLSSFMARDWQIVHTTWPDSRLLVMRGARDIWKLGAEVVRADLIFCWFGAAPAVWAALCNRGAKPMVVVAGGWDVAAMPEINYGVYASASRAAASRWLFRRVRRVFAVSRFNAHSVEAHARVEPARIRLIGHGFDPDAWPLAKGPRSLDVLTVGGDHIKVKGLDLMARAARLLPDVRFQIVGAVPESDRQQLTAGSTGNLDFVGPLSTQALRERMAAARVYLQPSRHESFGCAVAEAMLSGCVPAVSRAGALPEVVGDAGFYMDALLPEQVVLAVEKALAAPESARIRARQRVAENFALDAYAARLRAELAALLPEEATRHD